MTKGTKGTVKWFNSGQGYGFIAEENGCPAVFVRHSGIVSSGYRSLKEGDQVVFDIEKDHRGPTAVNVSLTYPAHSGL
jgi:CspA family cold shock protein